MTKGTYERTAEVRDKISAAQLRRHQKATAPVFPACTDPPHRWVIEQSAKQPGRCKKCGVTRNFGRITYDPITSQSYTATPTLDARTKVLLFLKRFDGVHVEWEGLRNAVGCSYGALGILMKGLLDAGDIVETAPLTYSLVEEPL